MRARSYRRPRVDCTGCIRRGQATPNKVRQGEQCYDCIRLEEGPC